MDHIAFKNKVFLCASKLDREALALELFRWQAIHVRPYRDFLHYLHIDPAGVHDTSRIPYMPVKFFKSHNVLADGYSPSTIFTSSGTSGQTPSRHGVVVESIYRESYMAAFRLFYGNPSDYVIFALLPAYLERSGSSLVTMAQGLIEESEHPDSGFFLNEYSALRELLINHRTSNRKILLLGVSFALLDLAEQHPVQLPHNAVVMETGGMKGRRRELIRSELHQRLSKGLGTQNIHSEYGMTELLSQSYALSGGKFHCPPWMNIQLRDTEDPLSTAPQGKTGGINIMDLANIHSCAFIATQDLGRQFPDGSFEVLGRFDDAEIRGCNLMVAN
ncbi:MAG: acyl transferase [Flavobacteriales bacterium]|nr:acyl transferase [Flavobacteriales bacterium]